MVSFRLYQFPSVLLCGVMILLTHKAHAEVNVTRLQEVMTTLARQTMMQQLELEERVRGSGHSGVKQVRFGKDGSRVYQLKSHAGNGAVAIHNHPDHYKTVGIGEFIAVMNGVDFRTRHNDYMLKMPSRTSMDYKAVEDIEFPEVPKEVLDKGKVEDQITEMREWFKAWVNEDDTDRDYTKHFKPLMCYLEGTWTETDFGTVDEPFESDRHHVSADNWYDLQEKIRFTAYTGGKDKGENYAFLPTKIVDIDDETKEPIYAQWNYRILCHPIKAGLKVKHLHVIDDIHIRVTERETFEEYANDKKARFQLDKTKRADPRRFRWDYLEQLMNEIPGMDNYLANVTDTSFGNTFENPDNGQTLKAGYYHSWYKAREADAMGLLIGHRSFSDRHLFTAFNTRPEVSPRTVRYCMGKKSERECHNSQARVSYAVPLEIVWLTPLHNWNPYDIEMKDNPVGDDKVEASGRNGGFTKDTAFNGNDGRHFYTIPHEFFSGGEKDVDLADTTMEVAGVLDSDGEVRNVTASGVRIFLPSIPGIEGNVRTRYPIFPIHEEGSTTYKDMKALEEVVMDMKKYMDMFRVKPAVSGGAGGTTSGPVKEITKMYTTPATKNPPGRHIHFVELNVNELSRLTQGKAVTKHSSLAAGHTHKLRIKLMEGQYIIARCDDEAQCWDGHDSTLRSEATD